MSESAVDQVTGALRALIADGELGPGDRLPPERELGERLGVSRPTMREAIRRLTEAQILSARQGSGTYVAEVDLGAVFEVRMQLEPFAAGLAAQRRSDAEAGELAALVRRLAGAVDEPQAFAAVDEQIHELLASAAGNPVLVDALGRLLERTRLSRAITSPERALRLRSVRELRALVKAVRARDAQGAALMMERHLASAQASASRDERTTTTPAPALLRRAAERG